MKKALIIFVRKPELGKVKTRLAATMGDEKAFAVYLELLEHTHHISTAVKADKFVFYFDEIEKIDMWSEEDFVKRQQSHGDLGEKMHNAFSILFEEGYNQVVIIGSDCPELTTQIIEEAFEMLQQNDAVLGPANDGGYYLLGLKKVHAELFSNIEWSTEKVLTQTLAACSFAGLSFGMLPKLIDIDTEEDLNSVQYLFSRNAAL